MGQDRGQKAGKETVGKSPFGECPQGGACALVEKREEQNNMKKPELPRGLRWRGDSLIACFALRDVRCNGSHVENCDCGKIERRALGEVSVSYAVEQLNIYKRQIREGRYQKR